MALLPGSTAKHEELLTATRALWLRFLEGREITEELARVRTLLVLVPRGRHDSDHLLAVEWDRSELLQLLAIARTTRCPSCQL